jgi:hypothetical protein
MTRLLSLVDFRIEFLCGAAQVSVTEARSASANSVTSMAALLLQYLKLIMLFALIGSIIGLSHFNGENQNGSGLAAARHRHSPARARKILVASGRFAPAAEDAAFVPPYPIGTQPRPLAPMFR